ncbi:MAG TPA: OB-fold nucleic acid binding domain-containing protein, partial [Gammaproteobacteria bacterium]|nr:OB-fold nucleic acid binding domain-containing protein [Gammaproteobacteria bacterium]
AGQAGLFGGDEASNGLDHVFAPVREWTKRERLEGERESLGLYLTGHPFEDFAKHWEKLNGAPIARVLAGLTNEPGQYHQRKEVRVAGVVMDVRRRGNRVSIVLDDDTDRVEVTLFDDVYAQSKHLVTKHAVLIAEGQVRYDDFLNGWRITARRLKSVDEAIEEHAKRLTIQWCDEPSGVDFVRDLKTVLKPFTRGKCEVCLQYQGGRVQAELTLGDEWSVRPTRELRDGLSRLLGEDRYSIHYPKHFV